MSEWPIVKLSDIAQVVDCEHKTAPAAAPGDEFGYSIGTPNIRAGRIDYSTAKRVNSDTFDGWSRRAVLGDGDLVLAREAPVGQVGLVNPKLPTCLGQRTVLVRPDKSQVVDRYLHAYLLGPEAQRWMEDRSAGSTVAHLNVADVREIPVALAPVEVQHRIGSMLGALDDLIETERELRASTLEMAQAVYLDAVAGSATEVPLRDVGKWLSGGTPSTSNADYWGGELPWISASSLQTFFLRSSGRTLTSAGASNGTRIVPAGAILFVVRGMSLKTEFRVGVSQRDVAFGQDCKAIIVDDRMPKATIAVGLLANSEAVLKLVDEAGHGTGRLPTDRIERLPIRLPDVNSMVSVERVLDSLLRLGGDCEESITDLTRTRDELLPLLMSGRVRINEE